MSKELKPRFVLKVTYGINKMPYRASMKERVKSDKYLSKHRIAGHGYSAIQSVENLLESIKRSAYDTEYITEMSAKCETWIAAWRASFGIVTKDNMGEPGICGVDQHNAANAETREEAGKSDGEFTISPATVDLLTPEEIILMRAKLNAEHRLTPIAPIRAEWNVFRIVKTLETMQAQIEKQTVTEPPAAKWHTITSAGTEIQRGIVPTQWGEVRVSLGECGEPGGSFDGKGCAAFSFWFEGWEYYNEQPLPVDETFKKWDCTNFARGFAETYSNRRSGWKETKKR